MQPNWSPDVAIYLKNQIKAKTWSSIASFRATGRAESLNRENTELAEFTKRIILPEQASDDLVNTLKARREGV